MSEEIWDEEDILDRLKDWSEDEHRNYVYPVQAKSILDLIKKRDEEIARLQSGCNSFSTLCKNND